MAFSLSTIFATSFLLALSGALMPGPLLTVTVTESTRKPGPAAGPLMICGHAMLELVLVVALMAGLAPILRQEGFFIVISLVGGTVLLWMGTSMLRSLSTLTLAGKSDNAASKNLIFAGIILSAINPYWLIWWASIGLGYIMYARQFGFAGILAFFLGHALADLAWYSFISFGIARGKHLLSDTVYRKLIGGCALFLLAFSFWFLYSGVQKALLFT